MFAIGWVKSAEDEEKDATGSDDEHSLFEPAVDVAIQVLEVAFSLAEDL